MERMQLGRLDNAYLENSRGWRGSLLSSSLPSAMANRIAGVAGAGTLKVHLCVNTASGAWSTVSPWFPKAKLSDYTNNIINQNMPSRSSGNQALTHLVSESQW